MDVDSLLGGLAPTAAYLPPKRGAPLAPAAPWQVVDAKNIQRQLGEAPAEGAGAVNEAQQQLAFADVVLLNKVRARGGAGGVLERKEGMAWSATL